MAPHLGHHHESEKQQHPASSSSKGQHYAETLDLARRLSLFDAPYPAQLKSGNINRRPTGANDGQGMDWTELLRKFRKHNPHRALTASSAQLDQLLHSLLFNTPVSPPRLSEHSLPPLPPILSPKDHPAASNSIAALEAAVHSSQANQVELASSRIVSSFGKYLVGSFEEALNSLQGVDLEPPRTGTEPYDLTLRVLGNAVRGFSLERLNYPLAQAREAYRAAARIYEQAVETISKSTKTPGARDDVSLHRIGETVLSRLCQLDLSVSSPHQAYTSHLAYIRQSALYHSTSPPSSVSSPLSPYPPSRSLSIHAQFHSLSLSTSNHVHSAVSHRAREALLRKTTSLPKAGQVNRPYLEFLDQVVESWKANGSNPVEAQQVVQILYNALTHTFQSHRLLRYLVRALSISTRYVEAGKAFKLYVELWEKSRQTDANQTAKEMSNLRKRAGLDAGGGGEKPIVEEKKVEGMEEEEEEEHDIDSDRQFIEIGSFGIRLLCRYLNDPKEAVRVAKRMEQVREEGKELGLKEDAEVRGRVELSLGIALGCLAAKEANPETRPAQHASSLAHLELASTLVPTSFHALYQLAYQLLELRQISRALDVAKIAVGLDKRSKRGWHLLGMILTAMKDMKGALQVFETALDLDHEEESEEDESGRGGTTRDALAKLEGTALPNRSPSSSTTEKDQWDYPTTDTERLAQDVQLRLSKNVVIEYLEGPASALEDQQELLAWFSRAYAPIAEAMLLASPPPPVPATSQEGGGGSGNLSKRKSLLGRRVSLRSKRDSSVPVVSPTPTLSAPPGLSPASASPSPYASVAPSLAPSRNASAVSLSAPTANPPPNSTTTKPDVASNPVATKLLVDIWLTIAASFRRAGKLEESKGAIWEAEQLDADDPDVWSQLALLHVAKGDTKLARTALQKAFSFSVDHLPSVITFSRLYLTPPPLPEATTTLGSSATSRQGSAGWIDKQLPFAEALLESLTKKQGWDSPEAWYELSRCYKLTERREKEKECLVWALQLEETRTLRSLGKSVERIL